MGSETSPSDLQLCGRQQQKSLQPRTPVLGFYSSYTISCSFNMLYSIMVDCMMFNTISWMSRLSVRTWSLGLVFGGGGVLGSWTSFETTHNVEALNSVRGPCFFLYADPSLRVCGLSLGALCPGAQGLPKAPPRWQF